MEASSPMASEIRPLAGKKGLVMALRHRASLPTMVEIEPITSEEGPVGVSRYRLSAMTFENQSIASVYDPSIHSVQDRTEFLQSTADAGDPYPDSCCSEDIEERKTVQSMEVSFAMMVDSSARIIPPENMATVPSRLENLVHLNFSSTSTPWKNEGKSTYRLFVAFWRLNNGKPPLARERIVSQGTAIHIGEGLFLTCAQVCRWTKGQGTNFSHTTHNVKLFLRSGSGNLSNRGRPGALDDLEASILAWPGIIREALIQAGGSTEKGLLPANFVIPDGSDFVLLKAKKQKWLARRRCPNHLFVEPESVHRFPTTFPATVIGVNNTRDDSDRYLSSVNTITGFRSALAKLLPNRISYVTASTNKLWEPNPCGTDQAADLLRCQISTSPGASGSGVYSEGHKLIGLCTSCEVDDTRTRGSAGPRTNHSESNRLRAIPFTAPHFRTFVRDEIVPEFRRIDTEAANRLGTVWAGIL
jgi:hypothetical protein